MKKNIDEFKAFITKGNVFNLAIGIIIGAAFGKIIASFVKDILMPVIGLIIGNNNIAELKIILAESTGEGVEELAIRYGLFIQTFIDFVIIALVIFMLVKMVIKMQKKEEEAPAAPPKPSVEETLLTDIRDILKNK